MMLDPYNQTDNPQCKSRADTGLSAITELDPGYITGMQLSYRELLTGYAIQLSSISTYYSSNNIQAFVYHFCIIFTIDGPT